MNEKTVRLARCVVKSHLYQNFAKEKRKRKGVRGKGVKR